jgi:capsular polysaccharide biosynthesis protein
VVDVLLYYVDRVQGVRLTSSESFASRPRSNRGEPINIVPNEKITILQPVSLQEWSLPASQFAELEQADCIGRYLSIHRQGTVPCRPPIFADGSNDAGFFFPRGNLRESYEFPLADVRLDVIPHAKIIGDKFVVASRDQKIFSESYWNEGNLNDRKHLQRQRLEVQIDGKSVPVPLVLFRDRPASRHLDGSALLVGNPWSFNYYHWVTNCLPRIWFREQFPELHSVPLVVPESLASFQQESLTALGIAPEQQLRFDRHVWHADRLFFPSNGDFWPVQLQWIRSKFLGEETTTEASRTRLLYISRTDAEGRRVVNEPEVTDYLQSRGFEIVRLSDLPMIQQARMFAEAKLVIGPHGSGLTNIIFGTSGLTLLELHPADEVNQVFWVLANAMKQRYAFIAGPPVNKQRDFSVPIERLKHLLDRLQ